MCPVEAYIYCPTTEEFNPAMLCPGQSANDKKCIIQSALVRLNCANQRADFNGDSICQCVYNDSISTRHLQEARLGAHKEYKCLPVNMSTLHKPRFFQL